MEKLFKGIYKGKRVFITGHTGFKGSWLAYWLHAMGSDVTGYSLNAPSEPNHFELMQLPISSQIADVRDAGTLATAIRNSQPDIVFHLAAQPLVRYSYTRPAETFETNVLGTVNVFEACRTSESVKAIVNITSDKAYENLEIDVAYKETDRMGGYDPYSASKGCAELVANCYRNSFFNPAQFGKTHGVLLASARAGNVIGGGDWAQDRLIPDIVKNSAIGSPVVIRHPKATRPWQHVLEPLSGYLLLGQHLLDGQVNFADGWNFGPLQNEVLQVEEVLHRMRKVWQSLEYVIDNDTQHVHEANLLKLDCTKANEKLHWYPVWDMDTAIAKTAAWYKAYYDSKTIMTQKDLHAFVNDAKQKNIKWTL